MAKNNEATKETTTKWKSVLWQNDSEIDWSQYTDEQLLEYVEQTKYEPIEADGYVTKKVGENETREDVRKVVKQTEGFQAYHKTPFDYQQLTNELKRRDYVQGWYKRIVPEEVQDISPEEETTGNSKEIAEYILRAATSTEEITYTKLPLYAKTVELINNEFGGLKKGLKGMVVAEVIAGLFEEKFGKEE